MPSHARRKSAPLVPMLIRIPHALREALEVHARERGDSVASTAREALRFWERHGRRAPIMGVDL
jgi:hypothetical protein